MALCKVRSYKALARSFPGLTRYTGRSYATAPPLVVPHERIEEHPRAFRLYTKSHIATLFERYAPRLDPTSYLAAAQVFPMRANNYVVEDLIDWSNVPADPIFQLVFPQPAMLSHHDLDSMVSAVSQVGLSKVSLREKAEKIRATLNPHPAGQKEENVPILHDQEMLGTQHKYRETILFFPTEGQYCHSFCTYCFRWAQFTSVGSEQQFQSKEVKHLKRYISQHPRVKDLLFTGGDPLVMSSRTLRSYISPLLNSSDTQHLNTIRLGTKSLAYWPYRFSSDPDSRSLLQLFSEIVDSGKHITIQAHFTHPRELEHPAAQKAMRLINMTGAQIRCQGPLIRGINDDPSTWARMWDLQTRLGAVPYYMFVERDTGAKDYFSVPLASAYSIFSSAVASVPGTARTARGPSMSASPGKIGIVGIEEISGERVFALKFFQARNPAWTERLFFAKFDARATWLDELKPAFGESNFFFEQEYCDISAKTGNRQGSSGQFFN
ncbi:hypothetical protein HO173_008163 [Letharia columbiana]|uniref:L-lysine 2,3-aminomutase n=2 Tax=Letharia TaxID=112415 RepID=A0A8H6FRV4_9LECA|nr:uncharacterized protein HO173_008163 [Letharia columbiana]KAF6233606.1 hypothetical protein HO173_008163 [Letharia columbiana]